MVISTFHRNRIKARLYFYFACALVYPQKSNNYLLYTKTKKKHPRYRLARHHENGSPGFQGPELPTTLNSAPPSEKYPAPLHDCIVGLS